MYKIIIAIVIVTSISIGLYLFNSSTLKPYSATPNEIKYEKLVVTGSDVEYFENYKGFLARPDDGKNYPGVIMIHEWWGLNQNIKDKAKELAGEGYIVLAVDLFGGVATTPEEARKQTQELNQDEALINMQAGINFLKKENITKIASLGWCFGGGQSLQLAVNENLDATVIYYGTLIEDKNLLQNINSPVLGIFGDQDAQIPVDKVKNFENNLNELEILNNIYVYEGVGHAFANPTGQNYAPDETRDSWDKTLKFLKDYLQ